MQALLALLQALLAVMVDADVQLLLLLLLLCWPCCCFCCC